MEVSALADNDDIAPPTLPPPLLSQPQTDQLCHLGYLDLDLPEHVQDELEDVFRRSSVCFDLPKDTKKALFPTASRSNGEHGYAQVPEEKEFITVQFRNSPPSQPTIPHRDTATALEDSVEQAWHSVAQILHRILIDISVHLGHITASAWDPVLRNTLALPSSGAESTPSLMRIFRYEPESGIAEPHRDLGLLTLCVCRGRGLQVYERSLKTSGLSGSGLQGDTVGSGTANTTSNSAAADHWRDAGAFTVLIGDTLRVLSGNEVKSGYHRVVATKDGRNSIVFTLRPSTTGTVDLVQFGGQGQVNAKALWDRIRESRVNINAQRNVREEQAKRWRERKAVEDIA